MFFLLFRSQKQVSRCFIHMIMKWWRDELMKINILKSYSSGNNQYRGGSGWNNLKDRCFWLWLWYFVDFGMQLHTHLFAWSNAKFLLPTYLLPANIYVVVTRLVYWCENLGSDALQSALHRQKTIALYTSIFYPKLLQYRAKNFPKLGLILMKSRKCAVLLSPLQSKMCCIIVYLFVLTFRFYYTFIVL